MNLMNLTNLMNPNNHTRLGPVSWLLRLLSLVGKVAYWIVRIALWILRRLFTK